MEREERVLQHELEEWKMLNEYINKMDTGFMHAVSVLLAVITGVLVIIFTETSLVIDSEKFVFFIPPIFLIVFAYLGYQFRIIAILRGHLAALEKSMNEKLGKNVHMWNSALVETFVTHNNGINQKLCWPVAFFVVVLCVIIVPITFDICKKTAFLTAVFFLYWLAVGIMIGIIARSFMENETIRHETEDEEKVVKAYKKYSTLKKKTMKKYQGIKIDEE